MPGPTADDVARATRAAAVDVRVDAAVLTRQPGARDQLATPRKGYWDAIADAAAVNTETAALIGTERRRFAVRVGGVLSIDASTVTPTVTLIDAGLAANGAFLISRIAVDDDAAATDLELFG
ncbi:hypothetical protein [Sandarakinorhabdus sp.]|uniref:hypothetical protein n=1 Tax=Sandarakinorhabdus sp. TaxID=1916663 RepID=UPI00286DD6CE|nr:hypothetical protein [Sandarakinorhabdus sp.]